MELTQSSKNKQTKNFKEQRELKVPMGQHEAGQCLRYRDSRRIKEKGTEKLFEVTISDTFPKLMTNNQTI